jgi:SulP family sulfate permease
MQLSHVFRACMLAEFRGMSDSSMPGEPPSPQVSPVHAGVKWWHGMFPAASWIGSYQSAWLPRDAMAGVTLAAYAVPVSLAYATLAGLPPQIGLYGYLLGGLGYLLFGSSRHLAIGPTSAISLLVGATVAGMAHGDQARYVGIAAMAAIAVAFLCVVSWFLRLSALMNFISETILLGFKAGAALSIASTQLPALLGVDGGGEHFLGRVYRIASQLRDIQPAVLAVGLASLVLLWLGEKYLPGRPIELLVVALSLVLVPILGLETMGVPTVGHLPAGLPKLGLPTLDLRDLGGLLPLAAACLLLSYIESISAARTFAEKHGYPLDERQELLSLGCANLAVGLGGGYPVAGGLSQTAVNEKAGARSPLSLLFASATLALCLVYLTGLVRSLPRAVLAAIVLMAVKGLIDTRELARVRRLSRLEFRVAMVALLGVLILGIEQGVLLAALVSLLMLLVRASHPHVAFLGRIPGTRRYSDLARHAHNERIPGVVAFRVEADILYFNVDHILHDILARVAEEKPPPRFVVCDLSTSPYVDLTGARMLSALHDELSRDGILLRIVEAHALVRDLLRAEGLEAKVGPINRYASIDDVVEDYEQRSEFDPGDVS